MRFASWSFILCLLLGSIALGIWHLRTSELYVLLGSMLTLGILSLSCRPVYGFALLILFILGLAFLNVLLAWNQNWSDTLQGIQILKQTIFTTGAIAIWLFSYGVQKQIEEIQTLQRKVQSLSKVDARTGVLTFHEFMTEAKLLFTGLKRRKEEGYTLLLAFKKEEEAYKKRILFEKLTKAVLDTVRRNYDIVADLGNGKLILFLSNTNRDGVDRVLRRLEERVHTEKKLSMNMLEVEVFKLPDQWIDFETEVCLWSGRSFQRRRKES